MKNSFCHRFLIVLTLIPVWWMTGCATTLPTAKMVKGAASYHHDMEYQTGGFQRSYRIHFPKGYDPNQAYPLVVAIHGAFDTAEGIERYSGFSDLADREQFIVMYPNGIGLLGYLQHWNAGHCCGKAFEDGIDDVAFLSAAIEEFAGGFKVDRKRIYMTGFSNGGMLTYFFGAQKSEMVAAIAPVAASFGGKASAESPEWHPPVPNQTLPVLVMHGLADNYVPFQGGYSERRGGTATFLPVPDSVQYWVTWNGCSSEPIVRDVYSNMVHQTTWRDCSDQSRVVLYTLESWKHYWPGPYDTRMLPSGHPLQKFHAAEIIWRFFQQYARDQE